MSKTVAPSYEATLHIRDHCLCLHTQRAARTLARRFDRAFRPFGLTNGQFSLLMALNRPEPPTMGAVASLLAMDRTTLTAALKPLERRGLLTLTSDAADRRSRRPALSDSGRALLVAAVAVWRSTHDEIGALVPAAGGALQAGLREVAALATPSGG